MTIRTSRYLDSQCIAIQSAKKVQFLFFIQDNISFLFQTFIGPMSLEEQNVLFSVVDKLTSTENYVFMKRKTDKIKEKIPGLGGKPFTIIVVASWRTGSTFLAQLVASGLKNLRFFIYEPLMSKVCMSL